jgi:hypothetical protein
MGWLFTFIMYFTPVMLFLALLAVVLMLLGIPTFALWIGYALLAYMVVLVLLGVGIVVGGLVQLALKKARYKK